MHCRINDILYFAPAHSFFTTHWKYFTVKTVLGVLLNVIYTHNMIIASREDYHSTLLNIIHAVNGVHKLLRL